MNAAQLIGIVIGIGLAHGIWMFILEPIRWRLRGKPWPRYGGYQPPMRISNLRRKDHD